MSPEPIRFKEKKPGQRACDEKDAKGEFCVGHLKRWFAAPPEVEKKAGAGAEIFRCERCHTLYRAVPQDRSSVGLRYDERAVNILGDTVRKCAR